MTTDPAAPIANLLREAESAHGEFERSVLGGVYDEAWPAWYADYLVRHGLVDQPACAGLDAARLAELLRQFADDYERDQPGGEWPEYYARRLIAAVA